MTCSPASLVHLQNSFSVVHAASYSPSPVLHDFSHAPTHFFTPVLRRTSMMMAPRFVPLRLDAIEDCQPGGYHPISATPLAMGFINSDSEAPLLFGWRATSRKREIRVESSPSRQCAPMFPHPRSQARSPRWLFLSLLPSLLISRPHNFPL